MNSVVIRPSIVLLLSLVHVVRAEGPQFQQTASTHNIWRQDSLTNGFSGLNRQLAGEGIELALSATQIYQQNVRGGISTHRCAGRLSGSYDLELSADLTKLLGIQGGGLYMLTEGVWSKAAGIDQASVGSTFGVNGDTRPRRSMDITELWYQHDFLDGTLQLRLGKIDLTGGFEHHGCPVSFDCSSYANDENTQFLNGALINNPTIPFPDYGLSAALHYAPAQLWYLSAAVADAQADLRETGFNTAFHDEDDFLYIFETGLTPQLNSQNGPLQGAYRIGLWYDPQEKEEFSTAQIRRDDTGFFLTFDQMLRKENSDPEDSQGLGLFGRYGWADSKVNQVTNFWSTGVQYQGLLPDRDQDVLALGFAQGFFSNRASSFTEDYESVWELYYAAHLTPWMALSPGIQYITNPGGDGTARDAVVFGVRLQVAF